VPQITVELLPGKTIEERRRFAELVTEAATASFGSPPDSVRIRFVEVEYSDVARAGRLLSDSLPQGGA